MLVRALKWAVGVAASDAGIFAAAALFGLYNLSALFASYPDRDGVWHRPPAIFPQSEPREVLTVALTGLATLAFGYWASHGRNARGGR